MKWITKEQVKEAAKDKMTALECSLKHHEQGRDCTRGELVDAVDSSAFSIGAYMCSCCGIFNDMQCKDGNDCPLRKEKEKGGESTAGELCCGGLWQPASKALDSLTEHASHANFRTFQQAESKVCDYIQAVIDHAKAEIAKLDKPKRRLLKRDGDYSVRLKGMGDYVHIKLCHDIYNNYGGKNPCGYDPDKDIFQGNVFDDIAERSKELESFEVKDDAGGIKGKSKANAFSIRRSASLKVTVGKDD